MPRTVSSLSLHMIDTEIAHSVLQYDEMRKSCVPLRPQDEMMGR